MRMVPSGGVAVSQWGVVAALLLVFLPLGACLAGIEFPLLVFGVAVFLRVNPSPLGAVEVSVGLMFTGCVSTRLVGFVRVVARWWWLVLVSWVGWSTLCAVPAAALKKIPSMRGVVLVVPSLGTVGFPGRSLFVRVLCWPLGA